MLTNTLFVTGDDDITVAISGRYIVCVRDGDGNGVDDVFVRPFMDNYILTVTVTTRRRQR